MIRAAAVIAQGLGGPGAQEHRARRLHPVQPGPGVIDLEDEVLRAVTIAHLEGRLEVGGDHRPGVGQGLAGDGGPGQRVELGGEFDLDRIGKRGRGCDQHHLGVRPVLSLGEQIRGDEDRARPAVGDHQHLRGAGGQVLRRAARHGRDLALGFRHPGVSGSVDLVHAAGLRGDEHRRVGLSVRPGWRAQHPPGAAGEGGGHGQHDGRRR